MTMSEHCSMNRRAAVHVFGDGDEVGDELVHQRALAVIAAGW